MLNKQRSAAKAFAKSWEGRGDEKQIVSLNFSERIKKIIEI